MYLPSDEAKLIVDLGVNIRFSTLDFLQRFPNCYVIGLEPHPGHFEQAQRNLELNNATDRVELRRCAAGSRSRRMQLLDRGSSSSLIENAARAELSIEVVDLFRCYSVRRSMF
jgi:FkbM family methyltransferase